MEEYYNQFRINCQHYNGFVTCSGNSEDLLYITFLCAEFFTLGLYHEELLPGKNYFQWPSRAKIKRVYQKLLKEVSGDNKYLRFPYL